jgi:ferredoxin-NADP reductase
MMKIIDNYLNKTTMYKVVLYYLMALWVVALAFSFFDILPYTPTSMLISLSIIIFVSWATNYIFAFIYRVPANVESIYITVFILALVITPALTPSSYIFLGWAGILAMASKYIFAINHKHLFNPAAFAMVITAFFLNQTASWWVGTLAMMPFVLLGGLIIVRKIKRKDLTISFFLIAFIAMIIFSLSRGSDIIKTLQSALLYSPLLFFTFIMITEPLTTPPSRLLRIIYGVVVALLFAPQFHIGALYFTPELALVFGNIFSYIVSPKRRLTLKLKEEIIITPDTREYIFESDYRMNFKPGQYLEWTLGHKKPDDRGNRRYFTIASSPTEREIHLGVKFYPEPSSFKKDLTDMKIGDTIIASQLSGDFVLPRNKKEKLVFIAGGIGITPFRSMIKYLIDKGEQRDIVLIYSNKKEEDIVYKDIFDTAFKNLNIKTIYTLTDLKEGDTSWVGHRGFVDGKMILDEVKDFNERTFYISGPPSMVSGTEETIKKLGLSSRHIKTDFFPGFA